MIKQAHFNGDFERKNHMPALIATYFKLLSSYHPNNPLPLGQHCGGPSIGHSNTENITHSQYIQ